MVMTNQLDLQKVDGYEARGNDSDRGPGYRIGYFKHYGRAVEAAKDKGFYQDGDVNKVVLYTDGYTLFKVEQAAEHFEDEGEDYEAYLMDSIRSKLTDEEKEFLQI